MTTARFTRHTDAPRLWVAGKLQWAALVCLAVTTTAQGQDRPAHWLHAGAMPPGAIGSQRIARGGPLSGYCQPVEIRTTPGVRLAAASGSGFVEGGNDPLGGRLLVGLQVGPVYRFRASEIPERPGIEIYPSLELVDRLYPPPGQAQRFAVPVELTKEELQMAADGKFVTRIVYVEDPTIALPVDKGREGSQPWFEARPGDDPLVVADALGRPIAILRMGGRVPQGDAPEQGFLFHGIEPVLYELQPAAPTEASDAPRAPTSGAPASRALQWRAARRIP